MPKMFFDPDTHEMVSEEEIARSYFERQVASGKYEWLRLYPRFTEPLVKIIDNPRYTVADYLLQNADRGSNMVIGSIREIAAKSGVSVATTARLITALQECDLVRRVRDGVWMINPTVIFAGSEQKRDYLRSVYGGLDKKAVVRQDEGADYKDSELYAKVEALIGDDSYEKCDVG